MKILSYMKKVCEKYFRIRKFKIIKNKGITGIPWAPELQSIDIKNKIYAMKFFPKKDNFKSFDVEDFVKYMKKNGNLIVCFVFPIHEIIRFDHKLITKILKNRIRLIRINEKKNTLEISPEKFENSIQHAANDIIKESRNHIANDLTSKLKECRVGPNDWKKFQDLCGEILTFLFVPPLQKPSSQSRTLDRTQIRDYIYPNSSTYGFWFYVRGSFGANVIIVDPKNSNKIKNTEIREFSTRLQPGLTKFGIIIFRGTKSGSDSNWKSSFREIVSLWKSQKNKMIVILNDSDFLMMLQKFVDFENPESVIQECINGIQVKV